MFGLGSSPRVATGDYGVFGSAYLTVNQEDKGSSPYSHPTTLSITEVQHCAKVLMTVRISQSRLYTGVVAMVKRLSPKEKLIGFDPLLPC